MVQVPNISIASEKQQRIMLRDRVGENLVAERGAFTFSWDKGGKEIRDVPFVYSPNFVAKVADIIQQHEGQVSVTLLIKL